MKEGHLPVLAEEVVTMLAPASGSLQIDATVGGGGHTERILEATNPDGRLLGLDADGAAIARVARRLGRFGDRVVLREANFRDLETVAPEAGFPAVDGLLFDLGLSSFQLADAERGFSFRTEGRIVKRFIAAERKGCICPPELPVCVCGRNPRLRPIGKPITPAPAEVTSNPRSRSARLRAAERLAA